MIAGEAKRLSGFTLIELLVTIALVAILSAVVVPNFSRLIDESRQAADVNDVVASLLFARGEAVKRRESVRFEIEDDGGYWFIRIGVGVENIEGELLRAVRSRSDKISVPEGAVVFGANGGVGSGSCTWDGCVISVSGGSGKLIQVSASGRSYLVEE